MGSKNQIETIGVANRGEVAVRIIHACQELGLKTVLLHSEADRQSLAYRLADERVCIGPAPSSESYLNIEANIQGALSANVDAIHPGFGFLSENADFAKACESARMVFIGPTPASIKLFGDKISAKNLVQKAGGPTVPGYQGSDQELSVLLRKVEEIGCPVIVKAAAGGGGRGLKVIREMDQAKAAIEAAQREGLSAFGSSQVFLEKYLERAKHIEIQVFGDALGRVRHLGERECSIQRRHQKMIEEAPAANLDPDLSAQMAQVAVAIAQEAQYRGAGTVEFLLEGENFYFLEMNTRLQVEHPVTELVYGVDLVKAQLLTAMGQPLDWPEVLQPRGHAIECRILAEDPYQGGVPSLGILGSCHWPQGPGRRFEVGFERGDEITQFYDSMIAKVIVWDENRLRAIQKMKRTLEETVIFGLKTNIPLLQEILKNGEFVSGRMNTRFMDQNFPKGLAPEELSRKGQRVADYLQKNLSHGFAASVAEGQSTPNPWQYNWGER